MEQAESPTDDDVVQAGTLTDVVSSKLEPKFRRMPRPGEPAPWFQAPTAENKNFCFDTMAGRRVVLCFFGEMQALPLQLLLSTLQSALAQNGRPVCTFFGVGTAGDGSQAVLFERMVRDGYLFLDVDRTVSELYGVTPTDGHAATSEVTSFVLDERLRIVGVIPWAGDSVKHAEELLTALHTLPMEIPDTPAPVLAVPRIFEPELCKRLIEYYERHGGETSGFMRDVDGQTVLMHDPRHKRRKDRTIDDHRLRLACLHRIHDRLVPEIEKAFQFRATRIERHIVSCYDAESGGHFQAHRDNTTVGTAHRKFAVSLNLNTGDYDGGMLRFPEFGKSLYQPPTGGALVFSCALLHEATLVSRGSRYAYLPFLYDDAAAEVRRSSK